MKQIIFLLIVFLTFTSCSSGYKKVDGKWAYVSSDEADLKRVNYLPVDNATFKLLKDTDYAVDKDNVYLLGGIIKNADPRTFKTLENGYSADSFNVFLDNETLIDADPNTFKILDFPYSQDAKKVYCGTLPLLTSDIEEFVVTESGSMKTIELTSNFIKFNPEYSWIDTTKYKGVIYGEGNGQTQNEIFDGYKKK